MEFLVKKVGKGFPNRRAVGQRNRWAYGTQASITPSWGEYR